MSLPVAGSSERWTVEPSLASSSNSSLNFLLEFTGKSLLTLCLGCGESEESDEPELVAELMEERLFLRLLVRGLVKVCRPGGMPGPRDSGSFFTSFKSDFRDKESKLLSRDFRLASSIAVAP
jgi:hypothetical protein